MTVRDSITRTGARTPGAEDYPTSMAAHGRAPIPTQCGITAVVSTCAKGRHKPNISRCMPGAGLSRSMRGKVLPYMPAFQPYRGKPAVRNDREGRGNVGIIPSPVRASTLPDYSHGDHLMTGCDPRRSLCLFSFVSKLILPIPHHSFSHGLHLPAHGGDHSCFIRVHLECRFAALA